MLRIKFSSCILLMLLSAGGLTATEVSEIEKKYLERCSFCHDTGYARAPRRAVLYDWVERLEYGPQTIAYRSMGGYGRMPAKGGSLDLSDQEYLEVANFLIESVKY